MNRFLIDHIDPLGQGVFKEEDQVYFIPKTLPGESGEFKVIKTAKGVNFASCTKLDSPSPHRIEPECEFFSECNGCHFLHTSYEEELSYKIQSYKKILSSLECELPEIQIIKNDERFNYRNRIQLHYSLKQSKLGFKRKGSKEILPITQCLIASKAIQQELSKLVDKLHWKALLPKKSPPTGHLEICDDGDKVHLFWNQKYAASGFSQVNQAVNLLLQEEISKNFTNKNLSILDLFGGGGNLVSTLSARRKLSVDLYQDSKPDGKSTVDKFHLDLFSDKALEQFNEKFTDVFDTLFLDPPRSGFKQLKEWTVHTCAKQVLYVSCHPATMVRDLKEILTAYEIKSIYLIEFFPGTYHFEAAIILNKRLN
jgi:23S rRNA (uracil1939-C5)-methyltransferase